MAKKKEQKDIELTEVKLESNIVEIQGLPIVIKSHQEKDKYTDATYIIEKDGTVTNTDAAIDKCIIISVRGGAHVNWTQIVAMIDLIKELRKQGAKDIKRYDSYYPGLINPLFNLQHALIKFSIR